MWIHEGAPTTAGQLQKALEPMEAALRRFPHKTLGIIYSTNHPAPLSIYLAALRTGHAVMLLPAALHPDLLAALVEVYQPDWIFRQQAMERVSKAKREIHPDLALLLPTSGTTGSPQMVRLSYTNLASNAEAIVAYLGLGPQDQAITSLPVTYSYGLSVVNSLLQAGGSLVLTDASLMQPEFWQAMGQGVTHLAGVPSQYQMLRRMGFERRAPKSLRILTQAGGRLEPEHVQHFATLALERDWRFFVMYGQTEATARIAYLPPERVLEAPDCIGIPIPGGTLIAESGELVYRGPNVMMGYARSSADLALGDTCGGVLHTGDIGEQNAQGQWKITGRLKRFIKLSGLRVNLDEVEAFVGQSVRCACTGVDNALTVWVEGVEKPEITEWLFSRFGVHPSMVSVRSVEAIPLMSNSKVDYRKLEAL